MKLLQKFLTALKSSILDIWLGSKYVFAFYLQRFAKIQLLRKLSEILHNFVSLLFFKLVALKNVSSSKPFSSFKYLQQEFLEKFANF